MRSLVKEITSKLPSHLGRVRIRSVLLQSDLFFTFSFNSIFFFLKASAQPAHYGLPGSRVETCSELATQAQTSQP